MINEPIGAAAAFDLYYLLGKKKQHTTTTTTGRERERENYICFFLDCIYLIIKHMTAINHSGKTSILNFLLFIFTLCAITLLKENAKKTMSNRTVRMTLTSPLKIIIHKFVHWFVESQKTIFLGKNMYFLM